MKLFYRQLNRDRVFIMCAIHSFSQIICTRFSNMQNWSLAQKIYPLQFI